MSKFTIRQPLVVRGALALVGVGVVRLGVWAGWLPADWATVDVVSIEQVIDGAFAALAWWSAHRVVTPVADPRDDRGRPLVEKPTGPYPMS
ncbi:hypothetical protein OG884_15435 [Streptosporangium sp. NBC_01755]|uniref:hypothetical protein n=1 Tax=Streptosporangium sp. NBC_01755 TaxID=2975949 RepID=UPI002DDC1774|nr:hypothetical protein [Streptosporangium sp. NBC_01755]WSD03226.1 hypothetical protein OG884_15435 [Streptosporangium sp. NBC_01755]